MPRLTSPRLAILLGLLSLAPLLFGTLWGIRDEYVVSTSTIEKAGDLAYAAVVPPSRHTYLEVEGDDVEHARRSRTAVLENGRALGPAHRPHEYIHTDGRGQFSHWISTLYFSTSDNSDPRINGRRYTVLTAATLPAWSLVAWAACVLASGALGLFLRRRVPVRSSLEPGAWTALGAVLAVAVYVALVRASLDTASWGAARDSVLQVLWDISLVASAALACFTGLAACSLDRASLTAARRWTRTLSASAARPFERRGWHAAIWRTASLAVPAAVFAALVRYPFPPDILLASYFSVLAIAVPAGVAVWCCHARRDWLGTIASLTVTVALFAIPLAAMWQHFAFDFNAIGGLLPFSDASGYYYDARRLIDGHPLGWSARRPPFVGLLSTLLAGTGDNLIVCVALLVALNAVATFLLARQLRFTHGPGAAAVATVVLFLFYRIEGGLGTVLTENLGLAMGAIAFAALWRALRESDVRGFCLGLGLLTLGLMSRAGAFFVLPALVLAGAWAFRRNGGWLRAGVGGVAAVALTATLTLGFGRILSDPAGSQTALSNFSYSLYGLVVGGKGWSRVTIDHPNATEGAEIYSLAWQAFRSRPSGIVEGSLRMWGAYLRPSEPYHAFAFVRDVAYSRQLQLLCFALSALGIAVSLVRYRQPPYALVAAGIAAHLASIPFVPPIDAGLRVYAATLPILAVLVSVGAAEIFAWGPRLAGLSRPVNRGGVISETPTPSVPNPAIVGVALALVVFLGPVCVFYGSHAPIVTSAVCSDGSVPLHVRFSPGSYLRIVGRIPDVHDTRVMVPEIREAALRETAGIVELKNEMSRFGVGNTMVNGYDLTSGRRIWLVAPTAVFPRAPAVLTVCGHDSPEALSQRYGVFYGDSVKSASDGAHVP